MNISITDDTRLCTKDYFTEFSTDEYLEGFTYFDQIPWFVKYIKELVRVFVHNSPHLGHDRALEFGGGPTLVSSFLLARYVQSITFSEYVTNNLKAVEDWMNQTPNAHDWTNVLTAITEEYHKQTNDTIILSEWQERLRMALRHGGLLHTGDVNERGQCPVLDNQVNYGQYDIVLCSFCLESACLTNDTYKTTIERFYTMLKSGGFLFLSHARNQTFYYNTGKRFHGHPLNEQFVRETLEQIGLVNIQSSTIERTPDTVSDSDGYFFVYAYKMK